MQLTQFTDYALRTLMFLSLHPNRLCTVKEVADSYGVSRNHMVKVIHRLATEGFITSVKGKGGGICLSKPPEEINLGEIVSVMEPNFTIVECFDRATNECCIVRACGLKDILMTAHGAFMKTLSSYTLADTVTKPRLFSSLMHPLQNKEDALKSR